MARAPLFDKAMITALSALIAACAEPEAIANIVDDAPSNGLGTADAPDGACGTYGQISVVSGLSAKALGKLYDSVDFDLNAIRNSEAGVPDIMLADVPADLDAMKSVERRKELFLKAVLPAITFVNERLLEQRRFLHRMNALQRHGDPLSTAQLARLDKLADCYGVASGDIGRLLRRVDVVPSGLGLAQAAIESAWGTSRFARHGNAILGQRTYDEEGIVPAGLSNPSFRVHRFDHILACVAAYARNLNTHSAYRIFRKRRAALRRDGRPPDSEILAGTLLRYSERGADYVNDLRDIIRSNRLGALDGARPASTLTAAAGT